MTGTGNQERLVLDQAAVLEVVDHDLDLLAELLEMLQQERTELEERIADAIREGDAKALRESAHSLKGAVSNFHAPAATERAALLEEMGERGDLSGAREVHKALGRELTLLERAVDRLVRTR